MLKPRAMQVVGGRHAGEKFKIIVRIPAFPCTLGSHIMSRSSRLASDSPRYEANQFSPYPTAWLRGGSPPKKESCAAVIVGGRSDEQRERMNISNSTARSRRKGGRERGSYSQRPARARCTRPQEYRVVHHTPQSRFASLSDSKLSKQPTTKERKNICGYDSCACDENECA